MKKSFLALTAAVLSLAGSALAAPGMGPGPGSGAGAGMGPCNAVVQKQYPEQYKKFALETLPIRQEMMNRHFDLQREYLKDKPDAEAIKKLQGEIGELRKKMIDANVKAGMPMGKKMGAMGARGHKKTHGGRMGNMMQDCPWMTVPPAPVPAAAPAK